MSRSISYFCTRQHGWLAAALLSASLTSTTVARADDGCGGVKLPTTAKAFGLDLKRNGVGIRSATFLNIHVYVAALYAEHPSRKAAPLLKADEPKSIVLHFKRDVSREDMVEALDEAMENNAGSAYASTRKHLKSFSKLLPTLKEGSRLSLTYRKGHGLEVFYNGRSRGVEQDDAFGNLLFRAFIGKEPADEDLKEGLLGGPCD